MRRILQEASIVGHLCEIIEILFLLVAQFSKCNCNQMYTVLLEKLIDHFLSILVSLLPHLVCEVYNVPEVIICVLLESTA